MNKVILNGFISTDIEFSTTSGGTPFARFNLGVKRIKDGIDFIPIIVWNQVAENVNNYCEKGSKILVEGRIQTGSYEKDGVKKYTTDVSAERVEFLEKKKVEDNPWEILKRDYPVDTVADVKIVSFTSFGAFAQIIPGVDGLIHISQIANKHIANPAEVLKVGEVVQAKITEIDFDLKRVGLSIRALLPEEPAEEAVEEVATEATEEAAE